jgi:hypothetical protein
MSDNTDEKGQVFLFFTKSVEVLLEIRMLQYTVHFHAHGRRHGPVSQHPPTPPSSVNVDTYCKVQYLQM